MEYHCPWPRWVLSKRSRGKMKAVWDDNKTQDSILGGDSRSPLQLPNDMP